METDEKLFIDDRPSDLSVYEKYTDEELDALIEATIRRVNGGN